MVELHGYQKEAVRHLGANPRGALFLDMGLGKTACTLTAFTPDHLPALVIAPKRVAEEVWPEETPKWRPDLGLRLAVGRPTDRIAALNADSDITVIGRDNIRDLDKVQRRYKTIVLDELSGFKNQGSVRFKTARKYTKLSPHVWGLTGTPSPNSLLDLWPQMYLLDNGQRLGRTISGYRERYFQRADRPVAVVNGIPLYKWVIRPGMDEKIHTLLEDICLSMESDGRIEIPPITYNPVVVPLAARTRSIYREMKKALVSDLSIIGGEIHTADNAAIVTSKLAQITAGFMFVDDVALRTPGAIQRLMSEGVTPTKTVHDPGYDIIHYDSVRAVKEVVEGTGSPVLVFYQFRPQARLIQESMPDLVHRVDEPDIFKRWNRGEIPVLLAHPDSIGHGLNLQYGGHTAVWASLPWSLEQWEQGNRRLARQGQEHPVVIHMIISPRTVDESKRLRLQEKASIQDALRAHLESPL